MSIYHRYVLSFGILSFDLRWVNHTFWSNVHFTQDHKIMWLFKSWHSQPRILTNEGSNQSQYMSQKNIVTKQSTLESLGEKPTLIFAQSKVKGPNKDWQCTSIFYFPHTLHHPHGGCALQWLFAPREDHSVRIPRSSPGATGSWINHLKVMHYCMFDFGV